MIEVCGKTDRLGLSFLQCRKLWGDLIEVYKTVRDIYKKTSQSFPQERKSKTSGDQFKLRGERFRYNLRGNISYRDYRD